LFGGPAIAGRIARRHRLKRPAMSSTDTAAPGADPRVVPRLGWPTKALYGMGQMGAATKATLGGLTLFFYTQLVGLDPRAVSLAVSVALLIDAFWDPLVGQFSDNTRTRLGRRHPFIYAAALPACLFFALIYIPPLGWSDQGVFFYLLLVVILSRLFESLIEIPAAALLPELSRDYDERTTLGSWRFVFLAVIGRAFAVFLTYGVFLSGAKSQGGYGQLNYAGYAPLAITVAVIAFVTLIVSAMATQRFVPFMHQAPVKRPGFGEMLREVRIALGNRNFASLAVSGFIFGIAVGITMGLQTYFLTYYWELPSPALLALGLWAIPGGFAGVIVAPFLSRRLGKKRAALTTFFMSIFCVTIPIAARLAGLMPPNSSPWVLRILIIDAIATGLFSIIGFVIVIAMLADVVEEAQVRSGKRSEGVLFAADSLLRKISTSFAVIFPGQIIAIVGLHKGDKPGHVDPAVLTHLALIYLPVVTVLYLCSTSCIMLYRIDRKRHEHNLETIAEAAMLAEESDPEVNPHPA
jgi:GPH family glycoside/pentoside/hexuronide:cation symporter